MLSVLPQENMKFSLAVNKALQFGKQEAVAMLISLGFASNDQNQFCVQYETDNSLELLHFSENMTSRSIKFSRSIKLAQPSFQYLCGWGPSLGSRSMFLPPSLQFFSLQPV